jgi:hypothetical protein
VLHRALSRRAPGGQFSSDEAAKSESGDKKLIEYILLDIQAKGS